MPIFADKIIQFFHEDGWPLVEVEPGKTWHLTFKGDHGLWSCYVQIREELFQFTFYSLCPINVPEPRRTAIAELLTRANSRLHLGNFEMEFDSGELRYRTSFSLDSGELDHALLRPLVYVNVNMMDRFIPAIMAVSYGGLAPLTALENTGILLASEIGNQETSLVQQAKSVRLNTLLDNTYGQT
jgi:hypothetical protein